MIREYINDIPDGMALKQMYEILIENLFLTYPEFLEDRDKHDNDNNFKSWTNIYYNFYKGR